jgi:2'-hydroxyisoflavone reductase
MRALIFGGTRFLGRHVVEACVAAGHTVTLFHRGLSDPNAFPDLEHLIGDRDENLEPLKGRSWDAVFDTSGFEVGPVRNAARAVARPEVHYTFVSSVSVYDDYSKPADESSAIKQLDGADSATLTLEAYGGLKAACEEAAERELPGRVLSVRAGIILGPHDNDERFAWLLRRVARGGEMLAPGNPDAPVQFIDVRDLAAWMVRCAEQRVAGVFNATGPAEPLTMRALLGTLRQVTGSDARFTWVPGELLVEHAVAPYSEMPFWLPAPFDTFRIDISRALVAGLTHRPVLDTVRDSWAWLQAGWDAAARAREHKRLSIPAGLAPEREATILADAHRRGLARS